MICWQALILYQKCIALIEKIGAQAYLKHLVASGKHIAEAAPSEVVRCRFDSSAQLPRILIRAIKIDEGPARSLSRKKAHIVEGTSDASGDKRSQLAVGAR